jgi:methanogenic corrinoid protein MtbC1
VAAGPSPEAAELIDDFLRAVGRFDGERAEQLLERASIVLSTRVLVHEVLAPLLTRIGNAWARGAICSASEHVASALVRDRASMILRQLPPDPGAALVVISTPAGELHELGAMLAATTAKMQGYGVLYLGPNLPAAQIALAARSSEAEIVALSVLALNRKHAVGEIAALVRELPTEVRLVLGGPDAAKIAASVDPRVTALPSLEEFETFLRAQKPRAQK